MNTQLFKIMSVFVIFSASYAQAQLCDVDLDLDVDRLDIVEIFRAKGMPATSQDDPRDSNQNGVIELIDARLCVASCSLTRCVSPPPNLVPMANAGGNQQVNVGELLELDGSASSDPESASLSYHWELMTKPEDSLAELLNSGSAIASFVPDIVGNYQVTLVVNDGAQDSLPAEAFIQAIESETGPNLGHHFFAGQASFTLGWQPWVSDGTEAGTKQIALVSQDGSALNPEQAFIAYNNAVYFVAKSSRLAPRDIWSTDGTDAGTMQVTDVANLSLQSVSGDFCLAGENIIFNAFDNNIGFTLAHSLSPSDEIVRLSSEETIQCFNGANFDNGSTHGNYLFNRFSLSQGIQALHASDGNSIAIVESNGEFVPSPDRVSNVEGKLFYFHRVNASYTTLWSANADGSNAQALHDFVEINSSRYEESDERKQMAVFNGKLYFNADDGISGHSLWVSDGTILGTQLLKDLDNNLADTEISLMQVLNNKLIFRAEGAAEGLWVSDGTSSGTMKISDTAPLELLTDTYLSGNTAVANGLYFFAASTGLGEELWATDGTSDGTFLVKDINPEGHGSPVKLVAKETYILFVAQGSSVQGFELWRSDGTEVGTVLLKDICEADYCSGALSFAE